MEPLFSYHNNLIGQTSEDFQRFLHKKINWNQRMIAIKGPRGTGKTTLMLQQIKFGLKNSIEALYATVDHPWFYSHSLLETAEEFVKQGGKWLFLDEVHKYPFWSRELKTIYDGNPKLKIVFSASSALDIYRGEADLSRRVIHYDLPGMSFREYLELEHGLIFPQYGFEHILQNHREMSAQILEKIHPLPFFKEYLERGYYPYTRESEKYEYLIKIGQTINAVIESDLATIEGYAAGSAIKLKKLMGVIAESVPFHPNISAISRKLEISRDSVYLYLNHLKNAKMLNFLSARGKGGSTLQKPDKIFLENSNLSYALSGTPDVGNLRETFLLGQLENVGLEVTLPGRGDFCVDGKTILEVGGKSKTKKQVENLANAYIVQDGIEVGHRNKIPIWLFGLMY